MGERSAGTSYVNRLLDLKPCGPLNLNLSTDETILNSTVLIGKQKYRSGDALTTVSFRIGLFGQAGAGKSLVATYIAERYDAIIAHPGALCREITRQLFNREDRTTLNLVCDAMLQIEPSVWVQASLRDCWASSRIVLDGVRFWTDYHWLREQGFKLWYVQADPDTRHKRLRVRGQIWTESDQFHEGETQLLNASFDAVLENGEGCSPSHLFKVIDSALPKDSNP